MFAYPDAFPYDECQTVMRRLRGDRSVAGADLAHSGWVVAGFALAQAAPPGPQPAPTPQGTPHHPAAHAAHPHAPAAQMGEDELAMHLEHACSEHDQGNDVDHRMAAPAGAGGFPWASLVTTLLPLILQWLQHQPAQAQGAQQQSGRGGQNPSTPPPQSP